MWQQTQGGYANGQASGAYPPPSYGGAPAGYPAQPPQPPAAYAGSYAPYAAVPTDPYPLPPPRRSRDTPREPEGSHPNLYVAGFSAGIDENYLKEMFKPYGTIDTVKLVRAHDREFAFVRMATIDDARNAIAVLDQRALDDGAVLSVKFARTDMSQAKANRRDEEPPEPNPNLYMCNLPLHLTEDDLQTMFAPYGTVVKCRVLRNQFNLDVSRGKGFVLFETTEEATKAMETMNGTVLPGGDQPLQIEFAQSEEERTRRRSALSERKSSRPAYHPYGHDASYRGRNPYYAYGTPAPTYASTRSYGATPPVVPANQDPNLFVGNLPPETDDAWMYRHFARFGAIESLRVICDEDGQCKGYGFVKYTLMPNAVEAMQTMSGKQVGDSFLKINFKKGSSNDRRRTPQ